MGRIEEIKQKVNGVRYADSSAVMDMEYLLSRLQIAEKAFNEILLFDDRDQAGAILFIANQALEQIHSE